MSPPTDSAPDNRDDTPDPRRREPDLGIPFAESFGVDRKRMTEHVRAALATDEGLSSQVSSHRNRHVSAGQGVSSLISLVSRIPTDNDPPSDVTDEHLVPVASWPVLPDAALQGV